MGHDSFWWRLRDTQEGNIVLKGKFLDTCNHLFEDHNKQILFVHLHTQEKHTEWIEQ